MAHIKMYWWNEQSNFGDSLNPYLVEKITGKQVDWSPLIGAELVGAGSLLQWVAEVEGKLKNPLHVWGSGYMYDNDDAITSDFVIHAAVRGQKSADYGKLNDVTLGDAGLLSDMLVETPPRKKYQIGLVPHLWHMNDPTLHILLQKYPDSKLIDVRDNPIDVIKHIDECEFIFSSSLHGLVVADSLNIPNQWVGFDKPLFGGIWKFLDYYTVYNMVVEPYIMMVDTNLGNVASDITNDYNRPNLNRIKSDLLASFPNV